MNSLRNSIYNSLYNTIMNNTMFSILKPVFRYVDNSIVNSVRQAFHVYTLVDNKYSLWNLVSDSVIDSHRDLIKQLIYSTESYPTYAQKQELIKELSK